MKSWEAGQVPPPNPERVYKGVSNGATSLTLVDAFDFLNEGGAVVCDNSEGYFMQEAIYKRATMRIDFYGFTPGVISEHCTSIYAKDKCFLFDPEIPIVNIERA